MLPRKPQQPRELKARAAAAISRAFDCRDGVPFPRPGECPECVFDYPDSVRLIASVELHEHGRRLLHVSGSFSPGSTFHRWASAQPDMVADACREMIGRAADLLSMDVREFSPPVFTTPKMVPHWFKELQPEAAS